MKKLIFLLLISFNANADYYLETAIGLHVADWLQTRQIALDKSRSYSESNPLLSKHPTLREIDLYMSVSGLAMIIIHENLSIKYKKPFRILWMINNIAFVTSNYSIGLKVTL